MGKSKKLIIIISVICIFIVATFLWNHFKQKPEALHPKEASIVEAVYGLGTVGSTKEFSVKFAIPVGIREVLVKEGQEVKKNSPLLITDENVVVRAPFTGTVTHINHRVGETIFPQIPILTIVDLKDLFVEVSLEQQGALKVRPSLVAKLTFESLAQEAVSGVVTSVLPSQDQFLAHIEVKNLPSQVLPGMSADVAIIIAQKDKAILIPKGVVANGSVLIRKAGDSKKIEKIQLKMGLSDGEYVEVISPKLDLNDEIVIEQK